MAHIVLLKGNHPYNDWKVHEVSDNHDADKLRGWHPRRIIVIHDESHPSDALWVYLMRDVLQPMAAGRIEVEQR